MSASDILIIGGGVAGLSAAAALSRHASVHVIEAEEQVGVHASGRSATMFHYALGNPLVRSLTQASRNLFANPPDGFDALSTPVPILVHAREDELEQLGTLEADMWPFTTVERLGPAAMGEICPVLKVGNGGSISGLIDRTSLRIDQHALMQGYLRQLRSRGGEIFTGHRIGAIAREKGNWRLTSECGDIHSAPLIVNAAGAWGDVVAQLAGIAPLGLSPLRRTIITFDAPDAIDTARLPFVKTIGDELYFSGESGRLFASPMDESESAPCDSQPDEIGIATAAFRMEQRTSVSVGRIHSKWSGLRTFAPDRSPVFGFAADADDFFWCVGQGGAGLQTSPGASAVVESLLAGTRWPIADVRPDALGPDRFARNAA